MILVDSSVWIDHFRGTEDSLALHLGENTVLIHPWVIGELACGTLPDRSNTLTLLQGLPRSIIASHEEIMHVIDRYRLMGRGIGYIDVALLASALLEGDALLWTRDRRLQDVSVELSIGYTGKS